jgi:hypothetical protein
MRSRRTMGAAGHLPSVRDQREGRRANILRSAPSLLKNGLAMNIRRHKSLDDEHSAKPAGAEFWHLWTVRVPRRSITGKLVWGRVWRRHDGRRWLYKCFVEFDDRRTASS